MVDITFQLFLLVLSPFNVLMSTIVVLFKAACSDVDETDIDFSLDNRIIKKKQNNVPL